MPINDSKAIRTEKLKAMSEIMNITPEQMKPVYKQILEQMYLFIIHQELTKDMNRK